MAKDTDNKRKLLQVETEDTYVQKEQVEETSHENDSESIKRKLLNLPQQLSLPSTNNNSTESTSPSRPQQQNKNDDKDKKTKEDNTERRKIRDDQKTSRDKEQNNAEKRQRNDHSHSPTNNTTGKDKLKETTNKALKKTTDKSVKKTTNKVAKKGGKKLAAKAAKAAGAAAKKLAVKGIALISKALLALVSYVGFPAILIGLAIVIVIVILMTLSTMMFGTGQGVDELGEEAAELRAYIVELSENSVDMSKPEQLPYRVPEELLAAAVQLESMLKENDNDGSVKQIKKLLKELADQLKPSFTYETFTEWTMTSTRECTGYKEKKAADGSKTEVCTGYSWSSPVKSEHKVEKITAVEAWNGHGTYEYEEEVSEWVESGDTRTKTMHYVLKEQSFKYDFSKLDAVLNSRGYLLEDKRWFEFFYESATNRQMYYLVWLETGSVPEGVLGGGGFDGTIIPGEGVPPQYMPIYLAAEAKYGVPWHTLAAIHFVETTFSTHPSMTSHVGAIGPMQFMPKTWLGWSYPGGSKLGDIDGIPMEVLTNPAMIKKYGGYGTDANGDGKADPWDLEDAIHTAAKYLSANGYNSSPRNAVWQYNHDNSYVDKVLSLSEKYKNAATYKPSGGGSFNPNDPNTSDVVKGAIAEASKYLGGKYTWGGNKPSTSFDCSGIIEWSYKQVGVYVPRVSRDQYKYTKRISPSEARPGDLVFFGATGSFPVTHVGIVLGDGKMLNAQNNGIMIEDIYAPHWKNLVLGYGRIPGVNE